MASKKKKEVNEKPVELDTAIEDEIIEDDYTDNGSGNDTKDTTNNVAPEGNE